MLNVRSRNISCEGARAYSWEGARAYARAIAAALAFASLAQCPSARAAESGVDRASDFIGSAVITRDGEPLGRVEDFAIDGDTRSIAYVVVSVGSFLIEDNLIAVHPDALVPGGGNAGQLMLLADQDSLRETPRFGAGNWPAAPDMLRPGGDMVEPSAADRGAAAPADAAASADADTGTATISSDRRTARLTGGERVIEEVEPAPSPAADSAPSAEQTPTPALAQRERDTRFDRLDGDGDGMLNRAEIAHEMMRRDSYGEIDRDGDGLVDRDEFDQLQQRRARE